MDLVGKLQLKSGQSIAFVNAPDEQALDVGGHPVTERPGEADAVIVFCTDRAQLDGFRDDFLPAARADMLTWIAYPKAGQLGTDLNRDVLAELVKAHGVRPVRQVALDDVWSALRVRPA
ncbi:MAG: hypothetical protein JO130_02105 [Solirubrobacterales bacterium]|nr:hypothetical protein [Solirubrobacterales bacterium]